MATTATRTPPRGGDAARAHEVIALTDVARAAPVEAEWRELAARIEGSSYFQTPDWVLAWWEDAGRPPMEIALWRDAAGALEGMAPLAQVRERLVRRLPMHVTIATNAGSGRPHSADRCGWPVLPHRVPDVHRWLATHRWRRALVLRHLDARTGVPLVPPGARLVLRTACPVLELAGGGDDPVIGTPRLRKDLRRWRRHLDAAGVTFTWIPPERMTVDDLETLFALVESRRTLKGPSSFRRERVASFHRALLARAGAGRGPAMVCALHDGRPIGAIYGFVWRDTFYNYQAGWDAAWARASLGTVLEAETIRLAHRHGYRRHDFLRGVEWYKYRLGAVDRMDESWLLPRGAGGWLVSGKYRLVQAQRVLRTARVRASQAAPDA